MSNRCQCPVPKWWHRIDAHLPPLRITFFQEWIIRNHSNRPHWCRSLAVWDTALNVSTTLSCCVDLAGKSNECLVWKFKVFPEPNVIWWMKARFHFLIFMVLREHMKHSHEVAVYDWWLLAIRSIPEWSPWPSYQSEFAGSFNVWNLKVYFYGACLFIYFKF